MLKLEIEEIGLTLPEDEKLKQYIKRYLKQIEEIRTIESLNVPYDSKFSLFDLTLPPIEPPK